MENNPGAFELGGGGVVCEFGKAVVGREMDKPTGTTPWVAVAVGKGRAVVAKEGPAPAKAKERGIPYQASLLDGHEVQTDKGRVLDHFGGPQGLIGVIATFEGASIVGGNAEAGRGGGGG